MGTLSNFLLSVMPEVHIFSFLMAISLLISPPTASSLFLCISKSCRAAAAPQHALGNYNMTPAHCYLSTFICSISLLFTFSLSTFKSFLMLPHKILSSVPSISAVRKFIVLEVRQGTGCGDKAAGKVKFSLLLLEDSKATPIYNYFL